MPGVDGAGIVVARGARVRRIQLGDRVYAYEFGNRQGGFYAEFAVVDAEHVARVPKRLDLRDAGAVAATGLTALQGINALDLRPGQTVLIFGASGAVGTMAVQFAAQRGAHVIATASGAAPARLVRKLGAHRVIDARRTESIDRLRTFAPDGLDGVLALAGGNELERCLDFVRARGRVVHPNGVEPVPMERRTFRVRTFDAVASPREFDKLNRHLGNGKVRVPIAASYPLAKPPWRIGDWIERIFWDGWSCKYIATVSDPRNGVEEDYQGRGIASRLLAPSGGSRPQPEPHPIRGGRAE